LVVVYLNSAKGGGSHSLTGVWYFRVARVFTTLVRVLAVCGVHDGRPGASGRRTRVQGSVSGDTCSCREETALIPQKVLGLEKGGVEGGKRREGGREGGGWE